MALPFTDLFTNTNGTALSSHDAGWNLDVGGAADIQSNGAQGNAAGQTIYRWTSDTPDDDQYIECIWDGDNSNGSVFSGLFIRLSASGNGYVLYANGSNVYLSRIDSYSETNLGSGAVSLTTGDVVRISVTGTSITTTKNGSATGMPSATDSNYASGSAGLLFVNDGTNARMASITIDSVGGGGGATGKSNPLMGCLGGPLSGVIN